MVRMGAGFKKGRMLFYEQQNSEFAQ